MRLYIFQLDHYKQIDRRIHRRTDGLKEKGYTVGLSEGQNLRISESFFAETCQGFPGQNMMLLIFFQLEIKVLLSLQQMHSRTRICISLEQRTHLWLKPLRNESKTKKKSASNIFFILFMFLLCII